MQETITRRKASIRSLKIIRGRNLKLKQDGLDNQKVSIEKRLQKEHS